MSIFKKSEERTQNDTVDGLRQMVAAAFLPSHVRDIAQREVDLLSRMNSSAAEFSIGMNYIEYLLSLPWNKKTEDNLDIARAEKILEERHYGLKAVKERIMEHLAVRTLLRNRRARVLIVDDEEIARKNLEHILKKENYVVETAADGMDALEKFSVSEFDVVMTDLKMSNIDGIALLEKIKSRQPNTMVIMITGHASIDSAVETIRKGAFHYITKPFKLDEVRATVREAVEKRFALVSPKGSVLCFSGPPGTGKTSLGNSIAQALGRKFVRISLGGIKDEAEIRGHRRTYAGALPGRIIEEIRRLQTSNPLIMLDEIDKIGEDFKGDPSSALLEVLDPEQNRSFIDHYLDIPFDLSQVIFIVTANVAENIHYALRDRMEIIEFSGYTEDEKIHIGLRYLVPKQIQQIGLSDTPPEFTGEAMKKIVQEYTREAGIRDLERQVAALCRKIALKFVHAKDHPQRLEVTPVLVEELLGPRKYYFEGAEGMNSVGIVTGLVWTDAGGDIIFVEAAKMKGNKELILTGSLGTVMRESAQAALSYIRSNASRLNIPEDFFENHDIHIHVPAGAIPKDGPSAGATIAAALISLLTERPARRNIAITGELTLSGRILPVGGLKEKVLAAKRAGIKTVIMPKLNGADINNLPEEVKRGIDIRLAEKMDEIAGEVL
ncbi:MAG: endopeptidase La, partial [Nitrospirota bacterium]|nr:endopeptidase La [Nitrospirota bacterium]